ncbi:MAG: integrase, partial [Candidatus Micrarchaeaceae archaeon]|uniref:integrase n=1 Tax=Metallosphaera sp. TaxID=2020860 RepID=UPI0031815453
KSSKCSLDCKKTRHSYSHLILIKKNLVRPPGFEPGISGLGGQKGVLLTPSTPTLSHDKLNGVVQMNSKPTADNSTEKNPSEIELIGFYEYCKKLISEETCKTYVNYLRKPIKMNIKNSVKAWKKYYRWKGLDESAEKLKIPKKDGINLYVPTETEIRQSLMKVKGTKLELLYRLLLESGIRLSEAIKVLREFDPQNDARNNEFFLYVLNWSRGTKKSFYVFHVTPLQKIDIRDRYEVTDFAERYDIVPAKYVRKFVATKMAELHMETEIIDFIQGRTPRSVLSRHYLNLLALAKESYKKYVEYLKVLYTTV